MSAFRLKNDISVFYFAIYDRFYHRDRVSRRGISRGKCSGRGRGRGIGRDRSMDGNKGI